LGEAPYSILDIRDVAAFCARIADRSRVHLSYHDREDLLAYLVETTWELSLRYDAGDRPPKFAVYAGGILPLRVVDWTRGRFGRTRWQFSGSTYERPRVDLVSLDDSARDRLEQGQPERDGDHAAGGDFGIPGLYAGGDRQRARDFRILGLEPPQRAA
jgi:hypothetical protein